MGTNLCSKVLNQGHEVSCLDIAQTVSRRNVSNVLGNENLELVKHAKTMPYLVEVFLIDNLACPASLVRYQRNPGQSI